MTSLIWTTLGSMTAFRYSCLLVTQNKLFTTDTLKRTLFYPFLDSGGYLWAKTSFEVGVFEAFWSPLAVQRSPARLASVTLFERLYKSMYESFGPCLSPLSPRLSLCYCQVWALVNLRFLWKGFFEPDDLIRFVKTASTSSTQFDFWPVWLAPKTASYPCGRFDLGESILDQSDS